MKEERIIAFIGVYACLILASTSNGKYLPWFWVGLAIFWLIRYTYLSFAK